MEPTRVLNADYLDIIYDQRNKEYGGYELRKHYNHRVGKAALFFFLGLGALISFSFITAHPAGRVITNIRPAVLTLVNIEKPLVLPKVPPPTAPPPAAATVNTKSFVVPKIVKDPDVPIDTKPAEIKTIGDAQPGPANNPGTASGIGTDNTGIAGKGTQPILPTAPAKPVIWVEQMPQFNGELNAYMSSHLKYPEGARATNIEGQVVIQFVIDEDGTVSDARVMHGVGGGCDEEALRMVNSMPKWKPGKHNGKAVKVFFSLPIRFVLN
jgi:protein TonB